MGWEILRRYPRVSEERAAMMLLFQQIFLVYWGLKGEEIDAARDAFLRLLQENEYIQILQQYAEAARTFARSDKVRARLWLLHATTLLFVLFGRDDPLRDMTVIFPWLLQKNRMGISGQEYDKIFAQAASLNAALMMLREWR